MGAEIPEKAPVTTRAGSHDDVTQRSENARFIREHRCGARSQQNDRMRHDPMKVAADDLELLARGGP